MLEVSQMFVWYGAFVVSATAHECAHAWAAKLGGDETAYSVGQVSLDPIPHIRREPFGMVVFPVISLFLIGWPFGYASTPYDPDWAQRYPRRAAWMAAAGPAGNLALLLLAALGIRIGMAMGFFAAPRSIAFSMLTGPLSEGLCRAIANVISVFFSMNLILLVLNLIPFPPLDGSSVITLFLKERTAEKFRNFTSTPGFGMIGLFLAWSVFNPILNVIFVAAVNLLYPGHNYE